MSKREQGRWPVGARKGQGGTWEQTEEGTATVKILLAKLQSAPQMPWIANGMLKTIRCYDRTGLPRKGCANNSEL